MMKSVEEVNSFYQSDLIPLIEPLKLMRSSNQKRLIRNILLFSLIPLAVIFYFILCGFPAILIFIFIIFFIYQIYRIYKYSFNEYDLKLIKKYKNSAFPLLLRFLFDNYEYIENQRISSVVLNKSMLINDYITITEGDDYMKFTIEDTDIMLSEIHALNIYQDSIFNGIFISASFNKEFTSKTFLFPKDIISSINHIEKQIFSEFKKVKLEDSEFANEFLVLSSDQIEARYILTTSLMQRILDYKEKINKNISLSFVDNRLYCAIPDPINHFMPESFEEINFNYINTIFEHIKAYTDLVEDLHLNVKIWNKE